MIIPTTINAIGDNKECRQMTEKRLYHTVAQSILDMIETESYAIGRRLPGERELAKQLGVSRVVVREAEISLEARGILEIKGGSGVYVRRTACR